MNAEERKRKIEHYGNAYGILMEALKEFPREMWSYKPSQDDWSIHATVVHIADSEANSFVRCRRFVAEPGEAVMGYDEMRWAEGLDYAGQSTEDALELFKWLRLTTYKLIQTLPETAWANTARHTENGLMTLDDWLDVYASHIPDHVEQMHRNYASWLKK